MLEHLALSESGFLFNAQTGATYSTSRTGAFLLRALMNGDEPYQLAHQLAKAFEVELVVATRDTEQFFLRLSELGLISVPAHPHLAANGRAP